MKPFRRTLTWVLTGLAGLYAVLLLPDPDPNVPVAQPSARIRPFYWNQDSTWDRLEARFLSARQKGCDLITILVQGAFQQWRLRCDALARAKFPPQAQVFAELEQMMFTVAPWVGACPQFFQQYSSLVEETRRLVKEQSVQWDFEDRITKETIYRLLYGGRMAVEEVILQLPEDQKAPDLVRGMDEPFMTPASSLLGVEIRSGDILVSRGGAPTSALIARGNDFAGNFSHIALAHVEPETHALNFIESHIEKGVAVATPEEYIKDTKLRVLVLRLRSDLPALVQDPMLPHEAAAYALERATGEHIPYDFSMDYKSDDKLFCSEVASSAYAKFGVKLWMGISHMTSSGLRAWLADFGVEHFETQEPSDLEYDPQLRIVAEWRDTEVLRKDRFDNAVTEVMLERSELGERLIARWHKLPLARVAKAYSVVLNWFGGIGPIPEGMSATSALKHQCYADKHAKIRKGLVSKAEAFRIERGYFPPYWWLLRLAREVAEK